MIIFQVTRIDTGAGAVSLKSTVIGYIVPDPLPLPPVIITDDNADRSSNDEERDPDPGNNPSSPGSSSAPTMTPISNSENDDNDNILSSKSPFNNMHNIPTTTVTPSSTSADAPSISDNTNVNNTPGVSQSGSQGSMMLGVMLGLLFFCLWGALCFYIYVRVRMHRSTTTTDTMDEGQLSSSKDISTSKLGYKQVARGQEDLIEIELNDTHPRHDAETNA